VTRDHARKQAIRARMAATGEPYSVAARALEAAAAEAAAAEAAAELMAAGGGAGEPVSGEAGAAEPMAVGSAVAPTAAAEAGPVAEPGRAADPGRADPAGALAEIVACAGRTLAAPSARIVIRAHTDTGRDPEPDRGRRPGLIGRLAGRAVKRLLGPAAADMGAAEFRELLLHQYGAGFVEPAARRYLIDFGGFAQVLVDGRHFSGLSGEPLGPRYENRLGLSRRGDPLDALGRLQRATAARWAGTEQLRWTTCRVVTATVGADEFTVWLDGQHVQRFQTVERGSGRYARATKTETVELWDFGVPVDELDWTRLPTFRAIS
jgi:hypothetical protein